MDYDSTLNFLQNLLTSKQGTQANQFQSNTDFAKQELGQQGTQFNAQLALQKAIQDWAQNSGQQSLDLQKRQQQGDFQNLDFQNMLKNRASLDQSAAAHQDFFKNLMALGNHPAAPTAPGNAPTFGYTDAGGQFHTGWN